MSASPAAAAELIDERLHWVSAPMGTSPVAAQRYLNDDALTALAHTPWPFPSPSKHPAPA